MKTNHQVTESLLRELVGKQYSSTQIANELNISKSSAKRLLNKYGIHTAHKQIPLQISKEQMEQFVSEKLSSYDIARRLGKSQGCIKHWLKKFGLKTHIAIHGIAGSPHSSSSGQLVKTCKLCNQSKELNSENFYIQSNGTYHSYCKSCNNQRTINRIRIRKQMIVDYKGGKCCICGYNRYVGALDFHHLDPNIKDFNISNLKTYSFDKLKLEADKCILVCKNCHAEIHSGLIDVNSVEIGPPSQIRTAEEPL